MGGRGRERKEQRIINYICIGRYNSLLYKDSLTPKLAAKRSANFLQIHFRFTSDSIQIQFRFIGTSKVN
ncbi:hypothetical protein VN97_g8641 [Penicillium thymicola]|uniref:Uncharacterized protein n=1 Tax=Penicillium thymicola TaxID=293382 RepID=A0AAI9X5H4_PENTH|nr:hypothetical protein VN97_g8641 [Penicillium thymicola]